MLGRKLMLGSRRSWEILSTEVAQLRTKKTTCTTSTWNREETRLMRCHCLCEHHTSHVAFSHWITRTCVAQDACLSCAHQVSSSCVCSDSLRLLHFPLFAHHLLSYHPVLPPAHQLHLPRCGGQIPCALSLMMTLASQVRSPTTTTSRRLLNPTSRNPRSRMGPRITSSTMTTPSARRSLHHCSPRSEKMMRAVDEPITLKKKVCRPVCRGPSVMIERRDLLTSLVRQFQTSEKIRATAQKMSKSGFFWNDKKSRLSLIIEQRFKNTSSRPIMTEEVSQSWMKLSSLKKKKFIVLSKETNDFDEIINFFMNSYWSKIGIFVKLMRKASVRLKNWSDFKVQHSTQFRGESWSKIKILSLNSQARYRRDFQDAESVRSGQSHVASQPVFFPPPDPGGMLSRSLGMPSRNDGPPSIWDTHGISGVFANPTASSSAPYPQESNPWVSNVTWIRDASQDRQPEIHPTVVREIFQIIMEQTNNDCRSQIFILTNCPRQQHSLVGR